MHLHMVELDRPELTLCDGQGVKIQLLTSRKRHGDYTAIQLNLNCIRC